MRRGAAVLLIAAACGGRLLGGPDDAGDDGAIDASLDASADVKDAAPFDVTGIDDIAVPATCAVSTQSLLVYYPLDHDIADYSGHGFQALGVNLPFVAGKVGSGVRFDGQGSQLSVWKGSAQLQGARTMCLWARGNATSGLGQPLFWGGAVQQGDFYSIFPNAPAGGTCTGVPPNVPFVDHWGHPCYVAPVPPIPPGAWSFVCYAYDGAALSFYVDGLPSPPVPAALYDYALQSVWIGSTPGTIGTTTNRSFDGDVDEVTIWSTALPPGAVAAMWNGGMGCSVK